jgi:glycerol-3-phosphate acyltransferase PlsX
MTEQNNTILALDAHGGDFGPETVTAAALDALAVEPQLRIKLVGLPDELEPLLDKAPGVERLELLSAESVIPSDARPVGILRRGEGSSLWNAMQQVADGQAHACISAGNTVALVTLGMKMLGTLPGIKRPALMSQIPSAKGMTSMLDLGANLNIDANQYVQFAVMGAVARSVDDATRPTVGLLNVGHEDSKGNSVVKDAHEMLRDTDLNYQGFIEGHDIFEGKVDVAVCDGFAGNLILKSSEGLAGMLFGELRKSLGSSARSRAGAWLARPALKRMLERLDPAKHNGAPLLGLDGVVVKSHGRAGQYALRQAILEANQEVQRQVPERISELIREYEAKTQS